MCVEASVNQLDRTLTYIRVLFIDTCVGPRICVIPNLPVFSAPAFV